MSDVLVFLKLTTSMSIDITTHVVRHFVTAPRKPGCVGAMTAAGTAGGTAVGELGLAGGPTVVITTPSGFALGGPPAGDVYNAKTGELLGPLTKQP